MIRTGPIASCFLSSLAERVVRQIVQAVLRPTVSIKSSNRGIAGVGFQLHVQQCSRILVILKGSNTKKMIQNERPAQVSFAIGCLMKRKTAAESVFVGPALRDVGLPPLH